MSCYKPLLASSLLVLLALLTACIDSFEGAPAETYACVDPDAEQSNAHPRADEFQSFLDDKVRGGMPGAMLWIRTPDGQVWAGASGKADMASGVDMQPCNLSRTGSITKTFTATLVMLLAEEGRVDLDAPIADYLSAATLADIANADEATVRQVLNHTSGIPNFLNPDYFLDELNGTGEPRTIEDNLDSVRGRPAAFAPGQGWEYSNTNYDLAGLLIEEVTGRPFEEVLTDRILAPLRLTNTYFSADGVTPPGTVPGYLALYGEDRVFDSTHYTMGHASPAGGAVSTVHDLATFLEALLAGEIVATSWVEEMQATEPMDPGGEASGAVTDSHSYGLGLMQQETAHGPALGHTGALLGYSAAMYHFPETDGTYVLLVNGWIGEISEAVFRDLVPAMPALLHQGE